MVVSTELILCCVWSAECRCDSQSWPSCLSARTLSISSSFRWDIRLCFFIKTINACKRSHTHLSQKEGVRLGVSGSTATIFNLEGCIRKKGRQNIWVPSILYIARTSWMDVTNPLSKSLFVNGLYHLITWPFIPVCYNDGEVLSAHRWNKKQV